MSDSGDVDPGGAKADAKRWLDHWKVAGPALEADRWARLQSATEATLQQQAWDLLSLWQPGVAADDGEGIRLQQRVFARLDRHEAA
jgi:hypothetical protein